jgi:succinate dehydrogenase hydrophobic anchor subunit
MHLGPIVGKHTETIRSFDQVARRARSPVQVVLYIALLAAAAYHGFYGLRGVLRELNLGRAGARVVGVLALVVGLSTFAYGAFVTIRSLSL